jgi:hypothetical protein
MGAEAFAIAGMPIHLPTDRAGDGIATFRRSLIGARVQHPKRWEVDMAPGRIMATPLGPAVRQPPLR